MPLREDSRRASAHCPTPARHRRPHPWETCPRLWGMDSPSQRLIRPSRVGHTARQCSCFYLFVHLSVGLELLKRSDFLEFTSTSPGTQAARTDAGSSLGASRDSRTCVRLSDPTGSVQETRPREPLGTSRVPHPHGRLAEKRPPPRPAHLPPASPGRC